MFDLPSLPRTTRLGRYLGLAVLLAVTGVAHAASATIAVAANFAEPMRALAAVLEQSTGHRLELSVGATGRLYAQIQNGAPFDAFLAADQRAPAQLEESGMSVPGSRFTYATGQLVLWSVQGGLVDAQGTILKTDRFRKLAIANPRTAPYGAAAVEVLEKLGLREALAPRLVQGESIGQTYNFAATGNADLAFVALSQVQVDGRLKGGSVWAVPPGLYTPIRQDAVLLRRGASNEAARALLALLRSPQGQALIRSFGYAV
jgi:molybdate transport system substrate-binding protein